MTMDTVISRADAKALGYKRYFTGKSCKHGHVSDRLVSNKMCCDCAKNKISIWRSNNPEKVIQYNRKYYANNQDKAIVVAAKWRSENPERVKDGCKKYRTENSEKISIRRSSLKGRANRRKYESKRRAIKIGNEINWTNEDKERVNRLFQEAAQLEKLTGIKFHVDHVVPLSRGGPHHPDNLQVVTAKYNMSNGVKTQEEMRNI